MRRFFVVLLFLLLLGITIYRCFWDVTIPPLERWDEATNVTVVSESIHSFPWFRYQGQPFFEKPPLWYGIGIIVVKYLHTSLIALRFISSISGFFIILLSAFVARQWWGNIAGGVTWIILLTTNHLFVTNAGGFFTTHTFRSADLDTLHILFLMLAFWYWYAGQKHTRFLWIAGLTTGLSVLTKGPLGFLPLLVGTFLFRKKNWQEFIIAWITALGIILPWYLGMILRYGEAFLYSHLLYHVTTRTVTAIEGHTEVFWYYGTLLFHPEIFLAGPLCIVSAMWGLFTPLLRKDTRVIYVGILALLCFLIPTAMQTKLAWYILPFYPFAALFIGSATADILKKLK